MARTVDAQVKVDATINAFGFRLEKRVAKLEAEVADLEMRVAILESLIS